MTHLGPYKLNEIYCGDCLELMKELPDKSFDLVLTDPPYGIDYKSNHRIIKHEKISNDSLVNVSCIAEFSRLTKNESALLLFTRWDVYHIWFLEIEKYFKVKNVVVWNKNNWSAGDLEGNIGFKHEFAIFATRGNWKLKADKRDHNVWDADREQSDLHPTEKPLSLIKRAVNNFSSRGDIIIDPFAGSGTTLVAAEELGRRYLGFEISEQYCDIARKRLDIVKRQERLFK